MPCPPCSAGGGEGVWVTAAHGGADGRAPTSRRKAGSTQAGDAGAVSQSRPLADDTQYHTDFHPEVNLRPKKKKKKTEKTTTPRADSVVGKRGRVAADGVTNGFSSLESDRASPLSKAIRTLILL